MQIQFLCVRVLYSMGSRVQTQWVVTSISHMGEMRDSDWSRPNLLRSDWLLLNGAIMTTIPMAIQTAVKKKHPPTSVTSLCRGFKCTTLVIC